MASSSFSSWPEEKYDVFLSFRGVDTRDNFTSHLYGALSRSKVNTYIDYKLERGDVISPALRRAIEESRLSVVIFSENYASSSWCLDELVHILNCKKEKRQLVLPVFYKIDPSSVRKQSGSFEAAFAEHEIRFGDAPGRVQQWREALKEAANLSGWDSTVTRPESKLVDEVVQDILKKLCSISPSSDPKGLVGIDERIEAIMPLLSIGSGDVRVVGLWGMGGIGKTTLAEALFSRISNEFESGCFLTNVRDESTKFGVDHLRNKLFSELLEEKITSTVVARNTYIQERLRRKRVIVVLDDVSDPEQLKMLVGDHDLLALGSRIIVTTRDTRVLQTNNVHLYEVKELDHLKSLELFHWYAFEQSPLVPSDFEELSQMVVDYTKGVPLALKVIGSCLFSKSKKEWERELNKLRMIPNVTIQTVLRISYDGLDATEKDIFLDIACFFNGEERDLVEKVLDGCDLFADVGIPNLIKKALITLADNKVRMHDLLQEMGWDIVRKESKELGKRSRLWVAEDILRVLKTNTGSAAIEGLFLDMSKIRETDLDPVVFAKMHNLRLLKVYDTNEHAKTCKLRFPKGLESLPDELRYLHWYRYPLSSLPAEFNLDNLVVFEMPHSHVERLWDQDQCLDKLRCIEMSSCDHLNQFPNLSQAPNLERMILKGYKSLLQVPSYFQDFERLTRINFSGNSNLKTVSAIPRSVKFLILNETRIEELPSSIESLDNLEQLLLINCKRLTSLSSAAQKLPSIKRLDLNGCSSLRDFHEPPVTEQLLSQANNIPASISFLNCLELDEQSREYVIAHARHRIICAEKELFRTGQVDVDDNSQLLVCCPGNRIPRWMSHQSEGHSVHIELSPGWFTDNFLGFAFCVVAEYNSHRDDVMFRATFEFKDTYGRYCTLEDDQTFSYWKTVDPCLDSEHLHLWYDCDADINDLSSELCMATEASFEFDSPFMSPESKTCIVKRCGVGLMYSQESRDHIMDEEFEGPIEGVINKKRKI